MLHAVLGQLEMNSFLEFGQKTDENSKNRLFCFCFTAKSIKCKPHMTITGCGGTALDHNIMIAQTDNETEVTNLRVIFALKPKSKTTMETSLVKSST